MSIYEITNKKVITRFFAGCQETMIWSCLQGYMGRAFADSPEQPKAAQILVADFCFFAGEPNAELVRNKPSDLSQDFVIMVPPDEQWAEIIEQVYGRRAVRRQRYAIKKELDVFCTEELETIVMALNKSYEVRMIDRGLYEQILNNRWAGDLCSQFADYEDFEKRGLGVVVLRDGTIVSGASSYTVYREGIEIEIDTKEDERKKGLALVAGAKLILECLKRGLYPSWDAQNTASVALAEKLGYHFDYAYPVYEIVGY